MPSLKEVRSWATFFVSLRFSLFFPTLFLVLFSSYCCVVVFSLFDFYLFLFFLPFFSLSFSLFLFLARFLLIFIRVLCFHVSLAIVVMSALNVIIKELEEQEEQDFSLAQARAQ
uniref:Transmembrane protein n=1 Tax=Rhipicephalus pulchellus TaxID=72859 RepID=L7LXY8_RHIPC